VAHALAAAVPSDSVGRRRWRGGGRGSGSSTRLQFAIQPAAFKTCERGFGCLWYIYVYVWCVYMCIRPPPPPTLHHPLPPPQYTHTPTQPNPTKPNPPNQTKPTTAVNAVLRLVSACGLGLVAAKRGLLDQGSLSALSRLIFAFFQPALLFTNVAMYVRWLLCVFVSLLLLGGEMGGWFGFLVFWFGPPLFGLFLFRLLLLGLWVPT
jgi:hypothetical protein